MQYDLFNMPVDFLHRRESSPENETILNANRDHFSKQCRKVFNILMAGEAVTQMTGMLTHKICDIRRRVKDLRDSGVKISERAVEGGHGLKEFYMSETDKESNKIFQISK